jgi:hypothetical protein
MTIAQTSLEAYRILTPAALQPKELAVLSLFKNCNIQYTREQIAIILGWKEAAVCGRANSLVMTGRLSESDGGITKSGRSAKLLHLPRPAQHSF